MIVNVKKYLLYGLEEDMAHFFKSVQKAGFIEFITSKGKIKELSPALNDILSAIKILKKQPLQKAEKCLLDGISLSERILHAQNSLHKFEEQSRHLKTEIARISPFGDFSKEDIEYIKQKGNRVIQFLAMKTQKAQKTKLPEELIFINTAYDLDYFIAINKEKKSYPKMIDMHIDQPVGILKSKLHMQEEQIKKIENELKDYAKYLDFLRDTLKSELNKHHLNEAKSAVSHPLSSKIFAVEAWIPINKTDALENLTQNMSVQFEKIRLEKNDRKPTYMENKGWTKVGEDLVHIYDTPSPHDKDPSIWVLAFFAMFFAMITSDAGYGLIFLILGVLLKWKLPNIKGLGKRFIRLIFLLASTCIVWGVLTASFFGIEFGADNSFRKVSLLHMLAKQKTSYHIRQEDDVHQQWLKKYPLLKNVQSSEEFLLKTEMIRDGKVKYEARDEFYDNILMEFSIFIGVLHLALSFFRYMNRNWSGLGWVLFMIGGYLYFPSQLNATSFVQFLGILDKPASYQLGEYLIYAGIGSAVILALLQRGIAAGLSEIMNLVQVFADVLSYLRLYALGLAGMIMASTFNDIGIAIGWKIGFIVIILGHLVNITLVIMGGTIHGLRLNFLEWYHYSFEGGGREFRPLKFLK